MKRWVWLAAVAIALVAPAEAAAFERSLVRGTQICLFWESRDLPWTLNESGTDGLALDRIQDALRASYASWESVDCTDITFSESALTSATRVGYDDDGADNLLVFRDRLCDEVVNEDDPCWGNFTCANAYACWAFASGVIAVTTTSYREDTGQIVDADIEFNSASFRFTAGDGPPCTEESEEGCISTDLANTATHEIGHVLGIDHTPVEGATMYASASPGETSKRSLATDDIDAICTIYPAGEDVNVCDDAYGQRVGGSGGGCGCSSGAGGAGLAWLTAGAGLLGWWRRSAQWGAPSQGNLRAKRASGPLGPAPAGPSGPDTSANRRRA